MPFSITYGLLAAWALLAALASGKNDRGPAFLSGLTILAGWLLYVAAWTPYAPAIWLPWFSHTDIWAMTDLAIAAVILGVARDRWWAMALWGLLFTQILSHVCYQFFGLDFATYSTMLDALFLGQLSVFFMLGGGRIVDFVSDSYDHGWHVLRPSRTAPSKKEQA